MGANVHIIARHGRQIRLLVDDPEIPKEKCSYSDWGIDEVREAIRSKSLDIVNLTNTYDKRTDKFINIPDWELEPSKLCALSIIIEVRYKRNNLRYCDATGEVYEEELGTQLYSKLNSFWNMGLELDKATSNGCISGPLMLRQQIGKNSYDIKINGRAIRVKSDERLVGVQVDEDYEESILTRLGMVYDEGTPFGDIEIKSGKPVYSILLKIMKEVDRLEELVASAKVDISHLIKDPENLKLVQDSEFMCSCINMISKFGKRVPLKSLSQILDSKYAEQLGGMKIRRQNYQYTILLYNVDSRELLRFRLIDKFHRNNLVIAISVSELSKLRLGDRKEYTAVYGQVLAGCSCEPDKSFIPSFGDGSYNKSGIASYLLERFPIELKITESNSSYRLASTQISIYGAYATGIKSVWSAVSNSCKKIKYDSYTHKSYYYDFYSQNILSFDTIEVEHDIEDGFWKYYIEYDLILNTSHPIEYWTHDTELYNMLYSRICGVER